MKGNCWIWWILALLTLFSACAPLVGPQEPEHNNPLDPEGEFGGDPFCLKVEPMDDKSGLKLVWSNRALPGLNSYVLRRTINDSVPSILPPPIPSMKPEQVPSNVTYDDTSITFIDNYSVKHTGIRYHYRLVALFEEQQYDPANDTLFNGSKAVYHSNPEVRFLPDTLLQQEDETNYRAFLRALQMKASGFMISKVYFVMNNTLLEKDTSVFAFTLLPGQLETEVPEVDSFPSGIFALKRRVFLHQPAHLIAASGCCSFFYAGQFLRAESPNVSGSALPLEAKPKS